MSSLTVLSVELRVVEGRVGLTSIKKVATSLRCEPLMNLSTYYTQPVTRLHSNGGCVLPVLEWLGTEPVGFVLTARFLAHTPHIQREPCVGIEPTTYCLQNSRTTAVLTRQRSKNACLIFPEINGVNREIKNPFPQNWGTEGVKPRGLLRGLHFLVSSTQ